MWQGYGSQRAALMASVQGDCRLPSCQTELVPDCTKITYVCFAVTVIGEWWLCPYLYSQDFSSNFLSLSLLKRGSERVAGWAAGSHQPRWSHHTLRTLWRGHAYLGCGWPSSQTVQVAVLGYDRWRSARTEPATDNNLRLRIIGLLLLMGTNKKRKIVDSRTCTVGSKVSAIEGVAFFTPSLHTWVPVSSAGETIWLLNIISDKWANVSSHPGEITSGFCNYPHRLTLSGFL